MIIIFLALCTIITTLRALMYYELISAEYKDIREIIDAHSSEIDEAIHNTGLSNGKKTVESLINYTQDTYLYLSIKDQDSLTGNIRHWPSTLPAKNPWNTITIVQDENLPLLKLLTKVIRYPDGVDLLVAYDLSRVDVIHQKLLNMLLENMLLSLIISMGLSAGIMLLVNRHLRLINITVENVIAGDLQARIPVITKADQFGTLAQNVNDMLDWIDNLLNMAKYSSNALAHDLRTPISRHRLELRALAEDPDISENVRERINSAIDQIDTLVGMFDSINSIAKAEFREAAESFCIFDIVSATRDIAELYAYIFEKNTQRLSIQLPEEPVLMRGDKQLLTQAVANLLDNASKYTPPLGEISVSLFVAKRSHKKYEIIITVADNGSGIPAQLREKVKERFFRLDTSRHLASTGLGLSLVSAVAKLHHGHFVVEDNHPGVKAVLTLSKPVVPPQKMPS